MPPNPTSLILWSAFGATHLVLLLVSTLLAPTSHDPVLTFMVLPALSSAAVSVAAPRVFPAEMVVPTRFILRWALAEAASLMGFVAWFLSGDHLVQGVCAGAGLLAWALARPTDGTGWPQPRG